MNDLACKVLKITVDYIGPAAQRFLERQTTSHLHGVTFGEIKHEHLQELAKWVNISAGLLIDKQRAEELATKIKLS
jgi:hypothetical protein